MKITAGTIARTAILLLALINQVLTACGISVIPIEDETINTLVSTGFTVVTAVLAWWKNNSFTKSAIAADLYMKNEKKEVNVGPFSVIGEDVEGMETSDEDKEE